MLRSLLSFIRFILSPLISIFENKNYKLRTFYAYFLSLVSVDKNLILYESYQGKNISGNPYAFYKELIKDPDFKKVKHVWAVNDKKQFAKFLPKTAGVKVKVIERNTISYVKYMAKAKYLINNTSFPQLFQKRRNQVYINTWHGTPLKTLGRDIKSSKINSHSNLQHNFLHVDYMVMPNRFTFEKLASSFDIEDLYTGKVIDAGYPRVDLTFHTNPNEMKKRLDIPQDKNVILYAPTWRNESGTEKATEEIYQNFVELKEHLPESFEIILKVHYLVFQKFQEKGLSKYCVPDFIDTNELLSCVDILITDYSSIFFDFLHTKKPIIFLAYDMNEYETERGFYIPSEELPGPICPSVKSVISEILSLQETKEKYRNQYDKMLSHLSYNDDGNATRRAIDIIFRNQKNEYVYRPYTSNKLKILLYGGGFTTNGITTSLINLLNNLDYSKHVIALTFSSKLTPSIEENLRRINPNVKVIYRGGTLNYSIFDAYKHKLINKFGLDNKWLRKIIPVKLYKRELNRIIGNTDFDTCIDFCGYVPFWTLVFAFGDFNNKIIYLHSDMISDSKRNKTFQKNFSIIFNMYRYFDKLFSVSRDVGEINKKSLSTYSVSDKIFNVTNAINYKEIFDSIKSENINTFDGQDYLLTHFINQNGIIEFKGIIKPSIENINFINVGRLSPEKDHEKLIISFHQVHQQFPNTKLYIVGDGPLKKQILNLIKQLHLENDVFLVGLLNNPFNLINLCDCFVLSSNYEGQSLVVLEALILKKAVISTDIPGPRRILEGGYGELVENSSHGLSNGMIKFIKEKPIYNKFDYVEYNRKALDEFYSEIGLKQKP
ncbi:CDP-glycerol glycerophosphotransferase family protein [Ornithinibacillus bavariensis]|uniref:CDP-glycerol glycerophosphotransferase family protein n=1 Tax=Ornithinibacillus bavariensis TaxID=545502 RepID=UPI000ECE202F|nr:spore coat protein CotS [Ornithinibacillus sp.]